MSWAFSLNASALTGGEAIWELKEFLVAQGWGVPRSGDGTGGNYNGSGDVHAPGGPYTGTLDLASAWFELRQPVAASPRRSFLFQIPSTDAVRWRIWYSSNGTGFTGGAQSATVRGTATDQQGLVNTPTGTTDWLPPDWSMLDMIAGDSSEGFSFFFGVRRRAPFANAVAGYDTAFSLDVLSKAQGLDADPAVVGTHFYFSGYPLAWPQTGGLVGAITASQTDGCSRGWYKKGLGGAAFVEYPPCFWGTQEGFVDTIAPRNEDRASEVPTGEFQDLPIIYWRGSSVHATQRGFKGQSRLFRTSQPRHGFLRPNQDLTRMGLGVISIPWDGATVPTY